MRRSLFFILIFAAFYAESFGQLLTTKYNIKWGIEEKVSRRLSLDDVVGYDQTGFYALKILNKVNYSIALVSTNRSPSFVLEHYNNDLKMDRMSQINLKEFGEKRVLEKIVQIKDNLYLFTSYADNGDKSHALYVQEIDKKNLKISTRPVEIASIDFDGNRKKNSGDYTFKLSRDKSKLFVLCMLPYEKDENEQFALKMFDENMRQLWQKDVTLPYNDKLFTLGDLNVDDQGNAYLLGRVYHDKAKAKVNGSPNYHYTILSYKNRGGDFKEYPVSLPDKYLEEMQISPAENGDIVCAGFYSEEGKSGIKGAYYLTVDGKTNAVKHKSFKEFSIDFIVQDMTGRKETKTRKNAEKGKDVELYNYNLHDIILKEDGGAVLVGEQFYYAIQTSTYVDANGMMHTMSNTKYFFNDIIAVNIDREGNILWANKIPKRQITYNDGGYFSSYTMAVVKDKLYFIYNDNPKNLTLQKEGKPAVFTGAKNAVAILTEVNSDGSIYKKALFSARDSGALARPLVCKQVSRNEVVIFCEHGKKHRFARLTF